LAHVCQSLAPVKFTRDQSDFGAKEAAAALVSKHTNISCQPASGQTALLQNATVAGPASVLPVHKPSDSIQSDCSLPLPPPVRRKSPWKKSRGGRRSTTMDDISSIYTQTSILHDFPYEPCTQQPQHIVLVTDRHPRSMLSTRVCVYLLLISAISLQVKRLHLE